MSKKSIFVTGGAGFIGSHTCVELLESGYEVTVYDNESTASRVSLERVEQLCGASVNFVSGDIRDETSLVSALRGHDEVIHFAGLKAVGESVEKPLLYYETNVQGTLCLLRAMQQTSIRSLVFSSSATVYGQPEQVPITENHPVSAINPYGQTKAIIETMLRDIFHSDPRWQIAILRYFNPVGAHGSGLIGEAPAGRPNNIMPIIANVALGKQVKVAVYGDDYSTPDGTGVRDYIHVCDLAKAHVQALLKTNMPQCTTYNLGTGQGYSVLELIRAYEKASGVAIAYSIEGRRPGDVATCYADVTLAKKKLDWEAQHGLDQMCADSWAWVSGNPDGYKIGVPGS